MEVIIQNESLERQSLNTLNVGRIEKENMQP
jgi:hypothetical protein